MRLRYGVSAAFVVLVGCFSLPSADEYASSAAVSDGGADGTSSSDATPAGGDDAGDAGDAGDASASPVFCPSDALLCDDFEDTDVQGPFGYVRGTPELTTLQAHSPTHGLHARVVSGQGTSSIEKTLTPPAKLRFSFWLAVPSAVAYAGYHVRVAQLLFGPGCDWDLTSEVWLEPAGLQTGVETYDSATSASCAPARAGSATLLAASAIYGTGWHHVVVDVDNTTASRHVVASVDDVQKLDQTMTSKRSTVPTQLNVAVGIPCIQTTAGCFNWDKDAPYEVYVDDVTVVPGP